MRRSANKKLWAKVAITLIASVFIILIATINGSGIVELFKSNPSAPSEETVDNSLDTIAEENPPLYLASKIDDNGGIAIGGGSANTGYPINTSDISVGKFHTIIADIDGFVYTRGSNEQQQLGLGAGTTNWNIDNATYHYNYLQPVVALNDYTITKVAAGGFHSLVIGYDHTKGAIAGNNYVVFTWGMQNNGRLGNGSSAAANIGIPQNISSRFAFAADEYPIDVSAGDHHSMLITNKGNLFTWGCNSDGQLGRGNTTDSNVPIKITTQAGRYMRISAGSVHSLALLNNNLGASNGELWSWGGNSRRQVGEVTTATVSTPARRFSSYTFTHIAAGELHSLAMNGALAYGWGDQRGGKLGDGQGQGDIQESSRHQHALTQITGQTWKANSASAGIGSFLITSGNELFAFGYGADTYYGTGNANTTIPRTTSIGSVSQVDRGLVVFTDNKIQHFGNLTHYSENWYGKASPPTLNGYINTTPNATYNVTKASAEMRTHVTPYKNIIGLPTVYSRSTNTNAVAAVHGVVFTVGRVKITSFHPTADNGGLAVAQVTKAVYDAATTTSSGGATFQSSGAKSYVLSREGYYVVRYKQNDTVVYKKFEIANASGPEVVINTQENQNNVFATISIYDGFGLKSLSINGQAWEPGGTTSTYSASSGDFPSDTNSIVYNTTFTITKNSINTFAVVATDLKGTTTSMNIDIDTVVYLNTANASKLYDGQPLPIEPVFYSKARGGFGLTTFNNVYGTNGYSATPIVYKKGATTLDGAPVDAAPEPYKASYSILKGGSAILTRETDILIGKATPIFPQHHAINIKYGQSLSAAGMPHAINPYDSGIGVEGEFEWQTPEIIPALNNAPTTTTEYLFNFDPIGHDATNYHSVTGIKANVTANLSTSLARIAFGADAATNTYDYDWETTKVVNNKARVGIKAVQNDSANYIFLGWQKGGNYKSINHSYVYEMVSEMPAETDTTFTAVFAQYRLNNNLVKQVDELYTGTPRRVNVDVDLFSQNPGLYRIGLEISSDVAPTGIGTYEVSFTIINTELGLPVFSPTIIFNVLETDVIAVIDIANSDGYNAETGWANSVAFRLSVSGTASGAVQKYIYSKDNGVTWQDVPGTPAAQPGCPIIFVAAAASEGQSYSESYIFKAVHATHGAGTHKSVASSTEEVHCKIDTVTPTISVNFANGYASEWINQDVTFDISATSGGSGIIIYYSTDGGESWTDTQLTSYNYGMTEQPIVNYDDLIFTRSDEQNLTYTFRVETGTSRNVILEDSFVIKIDKTAPIIAKTGITQTPNENGWIKDTAVVTLSITDVKADYSGILSITVDNDAAYTINSGEINPDNNSVYIFVPDYKVYTVTATDIAGNISTLEVWEKVDTKNPDFIVEGYTAGEWINDIANFVFTINAGASGVKVRYSIDGGASYNYWTEGDFLTTDEGAFQTIVAEHSLSEEQHNEYIFSVESGAGRITDITFGYVNIDKTAPDIVDDDPVWSIILANYKGDSPWRNEDVDMKFVARDTHELFNSGIDHSKVIVTNVGENVPAVHHGDGKYLFVVDKCTEYVISITDIAGNTTTANYTLKVDQGEPSFTSEAYIGETDELYTFAEDLWLSRASYGDNAFVRFVFNMNFTPSGAKMQFSTDGKDAGDSTKVWIDLTEVLFEEGNENGLEQNVTIRVDVKNQQNNPYMVRIISGSERVMEGENLGRIRIDFTPPVFETPITYYFNGTTLTNYNTITTVWGYEDIETRFKPGDTPSGVATVEVRRYAIGADHTNPSTPYTQAVITEKDGLSSFNMQEYAKFVIIMTDRAGNIFVNDPIMPRIDKTEGFSFTVDTNGYESGSWIYDEGVNVRFDFPVVFDPESGFSTFGPSGAALEFSINNGLWLTESLVGQTTQAVQNNGTLNPYMIAEVSQIRTYRFRLRTGTGRVYYDEGTYTVNKDTIQPTVTSTAKANGENYLGQWTYHNVDFTLNMVVGPSGAKYYWASSASPTITSADELIWEERGTLNESVGAERTYSVNTTTNGVYYYFRIVAGTGVSNFTTEGKLVKIDKATVSATATPYYNDTLYTGDWVSGSVEILVRNVNSGPSGYTVQYQTRRIGSDVYGEYLDAGYNTAENVLTLSNNTQNEYRLRLISGAGREYHTVVIPVKIDNEIPEFALFSSGTSLSAPLQNAGWWISDLSIIYNVTHTGESGYVLQYATSDDGVTWSEWTAEKINGNTMLLTDESGYGGTRAFYKMRALSGAGVSSVENNYGEIKIDTNTYTISAEQYVSGTLGNYATITNIISDYRRGDIVDSAINMTSGYFLKSLLVKSGEDIIKSEVPGNFHTVTSGFTMEISGENVTVELSCYKQISIIYNNRHQYLQDNQITPSFITVSEAGFNDTYGELDFSITYNGSLTVPQEIGVYTLTATVADDSFIIINPAVENRILTVVYFSGDGYEGQNPYLISSVLDMTYIDFYMSLDSEYNYLGMNRRRAAFLQTQDIELPANFSPIGSDSNRFAGNYDGGNFKVFHNGGFTASDNFGFFGTLDSGARVHNLGIEFDLVVAGENISAGLLAAETYSAEIIGVYAIGSIKVSGRQLNIGGLIGLAWNSTLSINFTDVTIYASDAAGNIGGVLGLFETPESTTNLNFFYNHTVSKISVLNERIDETLSVGAMVGRLDGPLNYKDESGNAYSNIYNMNNLSINRIPYAVLGFGNQPEWQDTGIEPKIYEVFRNNENIIGSEEHPGWEQRTVAMLTARRSNAMSLQGSGTDSDPFIIDSKASLKALEIFPYANFLQTANIIVSDFEMLNLDSTFTGVYDGGVYSLIAPTIELEGDFGGFFGVLQGTIRNVKLVDVVYNFSSPNAEAFYGGLAAVMLDGASIYNVIVSGSMNITSTNEKGRIYAGGIVGVVSSGQVAETISLVNINITETFFAVVGGIVGQAEGESELNNLVSLARVTVNYSGGGLIGSSVGAVHGTSSVTGSGIHNISGNTYANGRVFESSIGSAARGNLSSISASDYYSAVSAEGGIVISGSDVLSLIESLYPFSGGAGTFANPFIISSYTELLRVGDFMYATFELANDIIVGDYDGNGVVDANYNYNFQPIGKGAVFTGTLDGKNFSISNLTDSLFEINAGQVRNLNLNVYYAAYGENSPELMGDPRAKVLQGNQDVVFGAVAKYNRAGGDIKMVIVNGEIKIQNPGRGRLKVGGIIGVATGGKIMGSISHANIDISSVTADIGGIVGSVDGNIKIEESIMLTYNVILERINAYGSVINAGLIAGAIRSDKAEIDLNNQASSAKVFINGTQALEGEELVGLNPYA